MTESAAIYRVSRSFERKNSDKAMIQPMEKENWFAKSEQWEEPDNYFLNEVYW